MKRSLLIFCLVVGAWVGLHAKPINHRLAADLFSKFYDLKAQPSELGTANDDGPIDRPAWFKKICIAESFPIACDSKVLSQADLQLLLKFFEEAAYNSKNGGLIGQGLAAAKARPDLSFEILHELLEKFGDELKFYLVGEYRKEKAKWENLLLELPLQTTETIESNDGKLFLRYRSDGHFFSITVEDESGEIVFKDGPRWILYENNADRRQLNTSMTTTWSDPKYRGAGLYQYALNHYLKIHDVQKTKLYTENEETLEFIYRMKGVLYNSDLRQKLLAIQGIRQYLEALGVSIQGLQKGQLKHLRIAENSLAYLSLQGRTRLNLGFDFRLGESYPAVIQSNKISDLEVARIRAEMRALEAGLVQQLLDPDTDAALRILPRSYLQKLQGDADCASLLDKKAS